MKILLATKKSFSPPAVLEIQRVIESHGLSFSSLIAYRDREELKEAMHDITGLIVCCDSIDKELLAAAPNLKIIVRAGVSCQNIDIPAATKRGVVVMNTPGENANAVAELMLGLLIMSMRNFYSNRSGYELATQKIGIHAYGHVGKRFAALAKGLNMEVYAYDPNCSASSMEELGVTRVDSLEELYRTCTIISLHLPINKDTDKSVNYSLLRLMPANATLLNSAGKEIIDEKGLLRILKEREDFSYLTDIKPDNHYKLLSDYPTQYFATPVKIGAQTTEANTSVGIAAAHQLVGFLKEGKELLN